jgi:hypothetical protein
VIEKILTRLGLERQPPLKASGREPGRRQAGEEPTSGHFTALRAVLGQVSGPNEGS